MPNLPDSTLVPMRFADTALLERIDHAYTEAECARFVEFIERSNPSLATHNPLYRDQDRVMRDDPEAADELFDRIKNRLPQRIGPLTLAGLNPRLRLYRYREGQRFAPHMDHWYRPSPTRITLLTVLVYLNQDFEGGATRFMEQVEERVVPKTGSAAVFQHKIRHEGCEVTAGTKYAMRTDVFYDAPSPIRMDLKL